MSLTAKYIFVTGGVTSSLGKGIIAASLAQLLQARGFKVTIQKFDPYLNIDPGTLNPYEHGECYVTDDGAETDLDLGHYERFLNIGRRRPIMLPPEGSITTSSPRKEKANILVKRFRLFLISPMRSNEICSCSARRVNMISLLQKSVDVLVILSHFHLLKQ